jgi:hypothetical protein
MERKVDDVQQLRKALEIGESGDAISVKVGDRRIVLNMVGGEFVSAANAVPDATLKRMCDAAEMLWVVLANVSGGDWAQQSPEWQEAAARWRDDYLEAITDVQRG